MIKCKTAAILVVFVLCQCINDVHAQNVQNDLFDAMRLNVNPALTGMVDGGMRANVLYRNSTMNSEFPYSTIGVSVDAPLVTIKNGDYFGGGVMMSRDLFADGPYGNFSGMMSIAYHKFFGSKMGWWRRKRGCDLSGGIQGGYLQRRDYQDRSRQYFGEPQVYGYPGYWILPLGSGNTMSYYALNAGLSFSQTLGPRFNYIVGVKAGNINQPDDSLLRSENKVVGFDRRYTGSAGCNIYAGRRLTVRPALVFIYKQGHNNFIAGNEFMYQIPFLKNYTSLFGGVWYRSGHIAMVTAGLNTNAIRLSMAFDYSTSFVSDNADAGIEVAIGIITVRSKKKTKRHVPCTRF